MILSGRRSNCSRLPFGENKKQVGYKKVKDLMTRDVVTVREDDPLMECVDHLVKNRVRRLPVLDKTGKVVGMLYARDIFFAITKAMLEEDSGGVK
jgi:CBS domain-containing protein